MMSILAPRPIKNGTAVLDDIAIAVKVASGGSGHPSNRNAGFEEALCRGRGTAVSTRMVDKTHAISRDAAANHDMTRRSTILATGQTVPDPMPKSRVGWTVHLLQINNQMIQPDGMARCAPIGDGGSNSYNGASVNDSLLQRGHQRRELKNDRPLRRNPHHRPCGSARSQLARQQMTSAIPMMTIPSQAGPTKPSPAFHASSEGKTTTLPCAASRTVRWLCSIRPACANRPGRRQDLTGIEADLRDCRWPTVCAGPVGVWSMT